MKTLNKVIQFWKSFGLRSLIMKIIEKFYTVIRYWKSYGFQALLKRLKYEFWKKSSVQVQPSIKHVGSASNLAEFVRERFSAIQPLHSFYIPGLGQRLNVVTDSINSGSLFGGVATALTFSTLLAERWNCGLRIVTRAEPAHKQNFQHIIELNGIPWNKNVEFVFLNSSDSTAELPVGDRDVFLTTSWWTTKSVMGTFGEKRIIYLLQEDERAFYPFGDDHLRCAETLNKSDIQFIINTKLLYDYFVSDGFENIRDKGLWFEPSWPAKIFFREEQEREGKKNFFFYARPNNLRNLFYLGLEVIDSAVSKGILDPKEWEFFFVGKDIPKLNITNSYGPKLVQNVNLAEYSAVVRKMDLGLCLMYTPHPSYPPLDLAASGAVVVTNKYGNKQNLDYYSKNILCQDLNVDSLVRGIDKGVKLALNHDARSNNFRENRILRNWKTSFEDVLSRLERWPSNVSD